MVDFSEIHHVAIGMATAVLQLACALALRLQGLMLNGGSRLVLHGSQI